MKRIAWMLGALTVTASLAAAQGLNQTAPSGAKVYFISPSDGAEITGPVTVRFGLTGMGVAPAGIEKPNTGHHHLLIDQKLADYKANIPADEKHRHFGGGQTEVTLTLAPGQHTLQLEMADQNHIPFNPPVESPVITITVK